MRVSVEVTGLDEARRKLGPRIIEPAVVEMLNKTADAARTTVVKEAQQLYRVKLGQAKRNIHLTRASRRRLEATLIGTGERLPLIAFGVRRTTSGVSVQIRKDQPRRKIPSAFLAQMKSGHKGVFKRTGKPKIPTRSGSYFGRRLRRASGKQLKGTLIRREPIIELKGLSMAYMITSDEVVDEAVKDAQARAPGFLAKEIERRIARELQRT